MSLERQIEECRRVLALSRRCNHGDDTSSKCRRCKKYYNRWCKAVNALSGRSPAVDKMIWNNPNQ